MIPVLFLPFHHVLFIRARHLNITTSQILWRKQLPQAGDLVSCMRGLPDADVLAFRFGIPVDLGPPGITHSFFLCRIYPATMLEVITVSGVRPATIRNGVASFLQQLPTLARCA